MFTYPDVQPGLCNQKFFRDEALYQQVIQKPTIIQLKIEGKISFINLFLLQYDAHVIVPYRQLTTLPRNYCFNFKVLGSFLSSKHGPVTFVHEELIYNLFYRPPPSSQIEWLCAGFDGYNGIDGYKIVYIY